jgi:hypothetical protein
VKFTDPTGDTLHLWEDAELGTHMAIETVDLAVPLAVVALTPAQCRELGVELMRIADQ